MQNVEEKIFELENEVKELKEKLQEALHENDFLRVKSIHDFGAQTIIIESLKDENERLVEQIRSLRGSEMIG